MSRSVVGVLAIVSVVCMLALSACTVPPQSAASNAICDPVASGAPELDDAAMDTGIDAATTALGVNTTVKAPVVTAMPGVIQKVVIEGELISFPNLKATDPDGDAITYTFDKPLDKDGKWQTKTGDAGEYLVTITASDSKSIVSQKVAITVKSGNRAPVILAPATINAKEGETVALNANISDPDGDKVTVTLSGWMNATLKKATFNDAGTHTVNIAATDGKVKSNKTVNVVVQNVNRAPVITSLSALSVKEGEKVVVIPTATDPDGDKISFVFDKPLDDRGTWQTKVGDAGAYTAKVTVSDGVAMDSTVVSITVGKLNRPPVIANISDVTVNEGDTVKFSPIVSDPDGDKVTLVYSGWMTSSSKTTTYTDGDGTGGQTKHEVTLTATDTAGNSVKKTVTVTVKDANRPPVFNPGSFS